MSEKYLGKQFDLHAGGMDLLFPHHESEIAQSNGLRVQYAQLLDAQQHDHHQRSENGEEPEQRRAHRRAV